MTPSTKNRFFISLFIAMASGVMCWLVHVESHFDDFTWTLNAAHDLVVGREPYSHALRGAMAYPLPATAFALPFVSLWKSANLAGALFFGASSGLLAFGLTRDGYDRLLVFLAFPYSMAMIAAMVSSDHGRSVTSIRFSGCASKATNRDSCRVDLLESTRRHRVSGAAYDQLARDADLATPMAFAH
jgi:hypothetical protein